MALKDWEYTITEEKREEILSKNKSITDLTKYVEGEVGKTKSTGSSTKASTAPTGTPGSTGGTGPTTPSTGPAAPAPSTPSGGGAGGAGGGGAAPMSGGHSTESSRVRGIKSMFSGKITFADPSTWTRSGKSFLSDGDVRATSKWAKFSDVYATVKKNIDKIMKEEIEDQERHKIIGDDIDMQNYISGKAKWFKKTTVPSRDTAEINVIIALDASGSTGADRQYNMSGVTLAVTKALQEKNIKHSVMIYDDSLSLLYVDQKGRTSLGNVLASDVCGMGGNDEEVVLQVSHEIAQKNKAYKNVVIIISDGGVADVRKGIAKMKASNKANPMNVYCLGYSSSFDTEYAKDVFGEDFALGAVDNKNFANNFINILTKELDSTTRGNK